MKILRALVIAGASLVGVAHAQAPQEMPPDDVKTWLTFFDKLVTTTVKSQQAPCDKLASDVSSLVDANKPAITIAKQARQQGKKLPQAAQEHMLDGVKKMVPAMQKCGQNEKVRAAFAKLDLSRK
jgi:hypothetical protein